MKPNLIQVSLKQPDDFLKIKETLTRIGVASIKPNATPKIIQTCHILYKKSLYYIVHFKELFLLDGKHSTLSDDDILRRNSIIILLEEWDLLDVVDDIDDDFDLTNIKVISYEEKSKWQLVSKYQLGKFKRINP